MIGEGHKENFEDENVLHIDCGGGYLGMHICQKSSNLILKWMHLLYVNYTLGKLILKYESHVLKINLFSFLPMRNFGAQRWHDCTRSQS